METPKINFQGRDEEFPVDFPLLDNVWVGYYLAAANFHYIGQYKFQFI
jgi:hypothetical protein